MFYTVELLQSSNGPFALIWKLVNDKKWKATRKDLLEANVSTYCSRILMRIVPSEDGHRGLKFSLYLLAQLSNGVVLLHRKKTELLLKDFEELKAMVFRRIQKDIVGAIVNGTMQLGTELKPRVGKKGKEKQGLKVIAFPGLDITLADLTNDLNNRAMGSVFGFGLIAQPSDITLREMLPMPNDDDFIDDFGVLTPEQQRIMQQLMESAIGNESRRLDEVQDFIVGHHRSGDRTQEAVLADRETPSTIQSRAKTSPIEKSIEVTMGDEGKSRVSEYDLREEERTIHKMQQVSSDELSLMTLSELNLDEQPKPVRGSRRRVQTDLETRLSMEFLRTRMDDWSDTVRNRDELLVHVPVRGFVPCEELFEQRPVTLRRNPKLCELFTGSMRDRIALLLSEEIFPAPSAKRQRPESAENVPPSDSMETSEGEKKISENKIGLFLMSSSIGSSGDEVEARGKRYSFMHLHSVTGEDVMNALERAQGERDIQEELRSQVTFSKDGIHEENMADEMEKDDNVGSDSAARILFNKSNARESAASVQERERRSTGMYGSFGESPGLLNEVLLDKTADSGALKNTWPSNLLKNLDSVGKHIQQCTQTPDDLYKMIKNLAKEKNKSVVTMFELLGNRSSRLMATKTLINLLWLLKKGMVTAVQDKPFGDIRITII